MRLSTVLATSSFFFALLLTGCSLSPTAAPTPENGAGIRGIVHGGQQPIAGAHVYVFAAAASAYESPTAPVSSIPLLNSNVVTNNPANYGQDTDNNYYVTTDANGNFNITNDYTCTAGQQVYLYAVGGDSGGGANPAIGLLAILGDCPAAGTFAGAISFAFMDEVTTVASAYAMAGFALDATHVSYGGSVAGRNGLTHAFANASNLASLSNGLAYDKTPAGNGVVPQQTINTLANILAACINSPSGFTTCSTLFSNAASTNGDTPADTATAAINIAHTPGANVEALFDLPVPDAPFTPSLPDSPTPNDFTIAIAFPNFSFVDPTIDNASINDPIGIAIDGDSNVWITNYGSGGGNSVTKLNGSTGANISSDSGFTGGGLNSPTAVAIDTAGNAWVTNYTGASGLTISELNGSTGAPISGTNGYTGGGLTNPFGITIDANGYIWVANSGSTVSQFYGSNAPVPHSPGDAVSSASGYTGGGLNGAIGIAIDQSGYVWVSNVSGSDVTQLNGSTPAMGLPGDAISPANGDGDGGVSQPYAIAIDGLGFVWTANEGMDSVSQLYGSNATSPHNSGDAVSSSDGYTADGNMTGPASIAVDGSGHVWVANEGGSIYELYGSNAVFPNNPGDPISGANGYTAGGQLAALQGIALDSAGDVWVTDAGNYQVVEFIGAAIPVVTPLVANLLPPYGQPASKP